MPETHDAQYFCLGVPLKTTRIRSDTELAELRNSVRRARRAALLLPVVTLLIPLAVGVGWLSAGLWWPVGVVLLLGSPFTWGVGILIGLDKLRLWRTLRSELRNVDVKVYEGTIGSAVVEGLRGNGEPSAANESEHVVLEVSVASSRLLTINDQRTPQNVKVSTSQVAVPTPLSKVWRTNSATGDTRALSVPEIAELREMARGSIRTSAKIALFPVSYGAFAAFRGPDLFRTNPTMALVAAAFAAVGVITAYWAVRDIGRALKLRSDAKSGIVIQVATPSNDTESVSSSRLEVLTHSGAVWTVDGDPAPWRTGSTVETR